MVWQRLFYIYIYKMFVANAQISCFGKIFLQMQDFLVKARFFLQM